MKEKIYEEYENLVNEINSNYNKITIIDNYDFNTESPYTLFYLNKNDSFEKFKDAWNKLSKETQDDYCYDEFIDLFIIKNKDRFDFFELGSLKVYTDSEYELYI
jgi:hypothetical protein